MANAFRSRLGASGGVYPTGNAQPADVLAGKTFSNAEGIDKTGTMVNNGAVSETLAAGQSYTVPEGYHNGSGVVNAEFAITDLTSLATGDGSGTISANVNIGDYVVFAGTSEPTNPVGATLVDNVTFSPAGLNAVRLYIYVATATTVSFTANGSQFGLAKIS